MSSDDHMQSIRQENRYSEAIDQEYCAMIFKPPSLIQFLFNQCQPLSLSLLTQKTSPLSHLGLSLQSSLLLAHHLSQVLLFFSLKQTPQSEGMMLRAIV